MRADMRGWGPECSLASATGTACEGSNKGFANWDFPGAQILFCSSLTHPSQEAASGCFVLLQLVKESGKSKVGCFLFHSPLSCHSLNKLLYIPDVPAFVQI